MTEDGHWSLENFKVIMTNQYGDKFTWEPSFPFWEYYKMTLNPDGSFVFQDDVGYFRLTGNITGKTAQGKYEIQYAAGPVSGEWRADWEPLPTPKPTLTPAEPPKPGQYRGDHPVISFEVNEIRQVLNLQLVVSYSGGTCTLSSKGAGLNNVGGFSIMSGGTTGVGGSVAGDSAHGSYTITVCDSTVLQQPIIGNWTANWVGPGEKGQTAPTVVPTSISSNSIQPSPTPIQIITTFTVDARVSTWVDTGISIRNSDKIKIEASGTIDLGGMQSGPDGNPEIKPIGYGVVPTAPYGALVGLIGSGDPFIVGSYYQGTVQSDGNLKLLINDVPDEYANNLGQFQITITLTKGK